MRRRLLNKLNSFKTTLKYLVINKIITDKLPAFAAAILKLENLIIQIDAAAKKADTATIGKFQDKFDAAEALIEFLMPFVRALRIYGNSKQLNTLVALGSITETDLSRLNDVELIKKAGEILDAVIANLPALAAYNVTQEKTDLLTAKINTLSETSGDAHSSTSVRSGAGGSLASLIAQTDELFDKEIDDLAGILKSDEPEFYKGYKTARVIHDVVGSHNNDDEDTPPDTPPAS